MKRQPGKNIIIVISLVILSLIQVLLLSCREEIKTTQPVKSVPHESGWGIYLLDLQTQEVTLVYSFPANIYPSGLRLSHGTDRFVFAQKPDRSDDTGTEIFTVGIDGKDLRKTTENEYWDLYPAWSPDDSKIAFLSKQGKDLDIYVMDAAGGGEKKPKSYMIPAIMTPISIGPVISSLLLPGLRYGVLMKTAPGRSRLRFLRIRESGEKPICPSATTTRVSARTAAKLPSSGWKISMTPTADITYS